MRTHHYIGDEVMSECVLLDKSKRVRLIVERVKTDSDLSVCPIHFIGQEFELDLSYCPSNFCAVAFHSIWPYLKALTDRFDGEKGETYVMCPGLHTAVIFRATIIAGQARTKDLQRGSETRIPYGEAPYF